MTRINYRSHEVDLMARMMRAEAEGEGKTRNVICWECNCKSC